MSGFDACIKLTDKLTYVGWFEVLVTDILVTLVSVRVAFSLLVFYLMVKSL